MNREQLKEKAFAKEDALVVSRIMMVGATDRGEHVGLEIETEDQRQHVLLLPFSLVQRLFLSLLTAAGVAHRRQVARFGSGPAALSASGFSAFKPSGYDVGRVRVAGAEDIILLRLKQGELPVIDVRLPLNLAKQLARDIIAETQKQTNAPRSRH